MITTDIMSSENLSSVSAVENIFPKHGSVDGKDGVDGLVVHKMQADLSCYSHTIECNFLIERLHQCYKEHFIKKFFGYCDKMASDVSLCCHEERVLKRKSNPRYASRAEENYCLPESSYTATLKKLKEEGVLIVRPEDCEQQRFWK
ncbi:unnamed protein product [Litomosoides sigmodontis]|uniref:COX assembly mitochondrial protein n=1 Tax=Litomosoides sigmodontis TaxID=42156 RepID=A0A3P6T1E7_LITSI|nr:unnamed protein product [Litomosoides sigmodontis]